MWDPSPPGTGPLGFSVWFARRRVPRRQGTLWSRVHPLSTARLLGSGIVETQCAPPISFYPGPPLAMISGQSALPPAAESWRRSLPGSRNLKSPKPPSAPAIVQPPVQSRSRPVQVQSSSLVQIARAPPWAQDVEAPAPHPECQVPRLLHRLRRRSRQRN